MAYCNWVHFKLSHLIPVGDGANLGGGVVGVLTNNLEMRQFEMRPGNLNVYGHYFTIGCNFDP